MMVVSDDNASDQIEDDVEEDNMADWNDKLQDDCEDDYIGRQDDCSEDDKGQHNDIQDCNHANGSTGHATTVVLKEVQCDDHATTVELEDVEGADPIYDNPITLENNIRSLDDITTEESRSMDDHLYRGKVFPSKVELKQALSMLALKEHFEIKVKKSCYSRLEFGCKEKACKFALRATKLPEGEYWRA
ncbi:Uncharacterized protein TCM_027693 [Theobroma cacao]|uniref:Transposase MuDR plant domain-containing protein n=1 Tax=Theobroma cacao TaxID=3641 RepID=A0A061GA07_THECC|nr:Uncharacterized protein TCM_027693 [Theobroma cacao]